MEKLNKKFLTFFTFFFLFFFFSYLFCQEINFFSQSATYFKVDDKKAEPGDVLVKKEGKLKRAEKPYDKDIFGVVGENPLIIFGQEEEGALPVVTQGIAQVKVLGEEKIKEGDYLTSSEKPGFAKKASASGFVLGRALESFEGKEGKIKALIYPHEVVLEPQKSWKEMGWREALGRLISALERDVPSVLRYVFALLVAGGSFLLGFRSFVESLREGIRGISRNPLAKGHIRFSMILNLIGILILTLAGLAISIIVIIL